MTKKGRMVIDWKRSAQNLHAVKQLKIFQRELLKQSSKDICQQMTS